MKTCCKLGDHLVDVGAEEAGARLALGVVDAAPGGTGEPCCENLTITAAQRHGVDIASHNLAEKRVWFVPGAVSAMPRHEVQIRVPRVEQNLPSSSMLLLVGYLQLGKIGGEDPPDLGCISASPLY